VAGGWRRLHNEELYIFFASSNIIRVIKSRRMRWMGHVACLGEMGNVYRIWLTNLKGGGHSEDLGINGRLD
jgi:hypothetical protein